MKKRKRFYALDGHSLIYRAFYAPMAELTSPSGEPTKGTYVFMQMLFDIIYGHQPEYLAIALDGPKDKLLRRELYPPYKMGRSQEPKPEFKVQLVRITQIVKAMGIQVLMQDEHEADDILATIAYRFSSLDLEVRLVTRDKDLHQCVNDNVVIYDPIEREKLDAKDVERIWGVPPCQVSRVQALAGDPTDNIPGVKGVGKKKAVELLSQAGNLERFTASHYRKTLPGWLQGAMKEVNIDLMHRLTELRRDVVIPELLEDYAYGKPDLRYAQPIFDELGFRRWARGQKVQDERDPSAAKKFRIGFFN